MQPVDQLALVEAVQTRLEPISWFSVSVLIVTGLFQMSVNPHYNGFLSTSGQWSLAILAKHVLVAILIAVTATHTWEVLPRIRRALLRKDQINSSELAALQRREVDAVAFQSRSGCVDLARNCVCESLMKDGS